MSSSGLSVSLGVSPRQPLAEWVAQAAELEANGVERIWLIDSQLAPPALERFRPELERARTEYDYSQHLSTSAGHQAAVGDELARTLAVAGTAEECGRRIAGLLATGIDGCIFPLMGGGRLERLRVLREDVVPAALDLAR